MAAEYIHRDCGDMEPISGFGGCQAGVGMVGFVEIKIRRAMMPETQKVVFSSRQEIICHISGCGHTSNIDDTVSAEVLIDRDGNLPGEISVRLCANSVTKLKRQATAKRLDF